MSEYCRACLIEADSVLLDLFETNFELIKLSEIFEQVTGVSCAPDDEFSHKICAKCEQELAEAFLFRTRVQETDFCLKESSVKEFSVEEVSATDAVNQPGKIKAKTCDDEQTTQPSNNAVVKSRRHERKKLWECAHCGKFSGRKDNLLVHLQRKHFPGLMSYLCNSCGAIFCEKSALDRHVTQKHDEKKRKFSCGICEKRFTYKVCLTDHLSTHSDVRIFICPDCGSNHKTERSLKAHVRNVHVAKEYSIPCPQCEKLFKSKDRMKSHFCRVHKINFARYTCQECKKPFRSKSTLQAHQIEHSGEFFKCLKCPKQFRNENSLQVHVLRNHSNAVRRYECHICASAFFICPDLTRHFKNVHKIALKASSFPEYQNKNTI